VFIMVGASLSGGLGKTCDSQYAIQKLRSKLAIQK
jgi:hypothetical protein